MLGPSRRRTSASGWEVTVRRWAQQNAGRQVGPNGRLLLPRQPALKDDVPARDDASDD